MAVHLVQSVCTAVAVLLPVLRFASRRYGPVQGRHTETLSAAFVSYEIHLPVGPTTKFANLRLIEQGVAAAEMPTRRT